MRALGAAERALALLTQRAKTRLAFGAPLADQGIVQQQIAESRPEIEQARLLCHRAGHVIDTQGNKAARDLVAMAKVAVPRAATQVIDREVIDRAMQIHSGAGVTDVTPLAAMCAWHRAMRLFDGPDEVHLLDREVRVEPDPRPPARPVTTPGSLAWLFHTGTPTTARDLHHGPEHDRASAGSVSPPHPQGDDDV
jgi:acyl-CoA dehydrogenase